jgi:hypothetical protein
MRLLRAERRHCSSRRRFFRGFYGGLWVRAYSGGKYSPALSNLMRIWRGGWRGWMELELCSKLLLQPSSISVLEIWQKYLWVRQNNTIVFWTMISVGSKAPVLWNTSKWRHNVCTYGASERWLNFFRNSCGSGKAQSIWAAASSTEAFSCSQTSNGSRRLEPWLHDAAALPI